MPLFVLGGEHIYHNLEDGSIEMLYYEDEERRDLLFNADNTAVLTVYNQSILSALFMKCPHHEYLNITFNEVIFPMESIQKRISQRR